MTSEQIAAAETATKLLQAGARIGVLDYLSGGERSVKEIQQKIGADQPTTSGHLRLLRLGELVQPDRRGKHVFYSLTERGRNALGACRVLGGKG